MEGCPVSFKIDCCDLLQHVLKTQFLRDVPTPPLVPTLAMLQLPLEPTGPSTSSIIIKGDDQPFKECEMCEKKELMTTRTDHPTRNIVVSDDETNTSTLRNPSISPLQLLERHPSSSSKASSGGSFEWKIPRIGGQGKSSEKGFFQNAEKEKRIEHSSRFLASVGVWRNRDTKVHSSHNEQDETVFMDIDSPPSQDISPVLKTFVSSSSPAMIPTATTTRYTEEWYLLVASTPFSIAAQLVCVDSTSFQQQQEEKKKHTITPDSSPMLIWQAATASTTPDIEDEILTTHGCTLILKDSLVSNPIVSKSPKDDVQKKARYDVSNSFVHEEEEEEKDDDHENLKKKSLDIAIVVGTNRGRVLSFQLHIASSSSSSSGLLSTDKNTHYQLQLPSRVQEAYIEPLLYPTEYPDSTTNMNQYNNNTTMQPPATTSPKRKRRINRRFKPGDGSSVFSIQPYYFPPTPSLPHSSTWKNAGRSSFIWVTYSDGTMIRLFDSALFVSDSTERTALQVPISTRKDKILKGIHIMHPCGPMNQMYTPCPRSFPTILSQPLVDMGSFMDNTLDDEVESYESLSKDEDYDIIHRPEFFEAISFSKDTQGESLNHVPTVSFYSSEDQMSSSLSLDVAERDISKSNTHREHVDTLISMVKTTGSSIIGGTASIAKGVLGGFMGKFLSSNAASLRSASEMESKSGDYEEETTVNENAPHEERLLRDSETCDIMPLELPLATCLYDVPRKILHLSIDPIEGTLAACADNLGRVQLIDLTTKQLIRIWKGCRDATCHWMACYGNNLDSVPLLYLLIHSRLRNVIEVYRMRHGPREKTVQIQTNDTHLVQCPVLGNRKELSLKCFLFSPSDHSIENLVMKQADEHVVIRSVGKSLISENASTSNLDSESSIQLHLLQQLLSSEIKTGLSTYPSAVLDAFKQITAVNDLIKAIDILATASTLEVHMGIKGSSFHRSVISHVEMRIDQIRANGAAFTTSNDLLSGLSLKAAMHKQIIAAYNVIYKFEAECHTKEISAASNNLHHDTEEDEAQCWIHTFERVTKTSVDAAILIDEGTDRMNFSTFAKSCLQSCHDRRAGENANFPIKIHLCDSTKDRTKVLIHIFRPLLYDVFSMKTVRDIFEHLGIYYDRKILLQYFGEWFMCLKLHELNVKDLSSYGSAVVRFLESVIQEDIINLMKGNATDVPAQLLCDLRLFCSKCEDLPRAFLLAQTCLNAIATSTRQLEEKTYGAIHQTSCVKPWTVLLSKVRICLLISLRMSYIPCTTFSITVDNIEDGTTFSIFEWIARDELCITHKQEDLLCLEKICESIKDNGNDEKWKAMQQACVEESSKLSPLLYFLRHYNAKHFLAAHRALILATMWGREPENLVLLVDAMHAVRILDSGKSHQKQLSMVIRAEIWNNLLRPMYRALFFGFDQVYEVNEDSISHLITDQHWLREVVRLSLDLLKSLEKSDRRADSANTTDFSEQSRTIIDLWPPLKDDSTLLSLSRKWNTTHFNAIASHRGVICSLHLTNDLESIQSCFPHMDKMFLSISHMGKFPLNIERNDTVNDKREQFIIRALHLKAESSDLGLDEVIYVGNLFGCSKDFVFTTFVLCMYEIGKDNEVDDLVAASGRLLNIPHFVNGCLAIISVRLSVILNILKREKRYRSILSSLDADTCQFVHESSAKSDLVRPIVHDDSMIQTLSSSHSLTLRMMRISANIRRGEIHSLSILSGTLLQAIQQLI